MNNKIPGVVRKIIMGTMMFASVVIIMAILNPRMFLLVMNVIWTLIFTVAAIFVVVGVLTVIGRKNEASKVIDLVIEGSVTAIDLLELIKLLLETFVETLKKAILIATPYGAYFVAALVYLAILVFYKDFGRTQDVALMTIILTMFVTAVTSVMNKPKSKDLYKVKKKKNPFTLRIKNSFNRHFIDGFEVAVFVLFITIDSTNLFFLPESLNNELHAVLGGYDFMIRGYSTTAINWTVKLVVLGLILEFFRNALRLFAEAMYYYKFKEKYLAKSLGKGAGELAKGLIRLTVSNSKDEIMKFTAFTTFMMIVFLFFPRLKLAALITASGTNLLFDIIMPARLTFRESDDLLNRTFNKAFKLGGQEKFVEEKNETTLNMTG